MAGQCTPRVCATNLHAVSSRRNVKTLDRIEGFDVKTQLHHCFEICRTMPSTGSALKIDFLKEYKGIREAMTLEAKNRGMEKFQLLRQDTPNRMIVRRIIDEVLPHTVISKARTHCRHDRVFYKHGCRFQRAGRRLSYKMDARLLVGR